ncbi:MAG TPA: cysteine desulfurase-like protein [Thermoanaerobaculia bacterium]|nr:cysteine desulfurase-like protein [Thermoanaerobaculia bacterium]
MSDLMSTNEIRSQFPALQRLHNGRNVAYFDAPGGTQVPRGVAVAMTNYLLEHNANTHWGYPTSDETDAIIAGSRLAAADFLNSSPQEIVFGANMTTLTFHLARTLGRTWSSGDEVLVTELDHDANVAPWRALERDRGVVLRMVPVNLETLQLDLDAMEKLVSPRTKLIAVCGASNAVGAMPDLIRVGAIARAAGALLFVDAVHLAPHELVDVKRIECDFLACSPYKFYGPHTGILYARDELLQSLPFPKLAPAPDNAPDRAETGTLNHEGIAGIGAAIEFLASLGGDRGSRRERLHRGYIEQHARGTNLLRILHEGLSAIKGVRIYGPALEADRTPTLSFTLEGVAAEEISRRLADQAIFASHGNFYASTLIERLGVDGLLRVGCGCYTTEDEVRRLVEEVGRMAKR